MKLPIIQILIKSWLKPDLKPFTSKTPSYMNSAPQSDLTSDSDVDGVTGRSLCGLAPVNPAVQRVDITDMTWRTIYFSPAGSTCSFLFIARVPPKHPPGEAVVHLAAQRDGLPAEELRPARTHGQVGWKERATGSSGWNAFVHNNPLQILNTNFSVWKRVRRVFRLR